MSETLAFKSETLTAIGKKAGMTVEQIKKLPTVAQLMARRGKKEGEITVAKEGLTPTAFIWQEGQWAVFGEVVT